MPQMGDEFLVSIRNEVVNVHGPESAHFPYHRHVSAPTRAVPSTPLLASFDESIEGESQHQHVDRLNGLNIAGYFEDGVEKVREDLLAFGHAGSVGVNSHIVDAFGMYGGAHFASDCAVSYNVDDANAGNVPDEWHGKTTVMVRNISYKCTLAVFRRTICEAGFDRAFDYMHVPTDRNTSTSKGYAFINFVDAPTAYRFKLVFDSSSMGIAGQNKVLDVRPANLQGYEKNVTHSDITHPKPDVFVCPSKSVHTASRTSKPLSDTVRAFPPPIESGEAPPVCSQCKVFGIETSDKFCRWCGSAMEQSAPRPRLEELPFCSQCQVFGIQHQMYCQWCGDALQVSSGSELQSARNKACR
eukprot:TRINITY_DN7448_c0_g3_i1.p1 TRINITY_DN7448_c0_g3~~TRINITY_DN7448_c0_g3_i1.p1  ORF type:complete len:356 (+),score=18.53 TRINITY_DN7448_c0_g3_i1:238-1305(+)